MGSHLQEVGFYETYLGKLLHFLKGGNIQHVTQVFAVRSGKVGLIDGFNVTEQSHVANRAIDCILKDMSDYYFLIESEENLDSTDRRYHRITLIHNISTVFEQLNCHAARFILVHMMNTTSYIHHMLAEQLLLKLNLAGCTPLINEIFPHVNLSMVWYWQLVSKYGDERSMGLLFDRLENEYAQEFPQIDSWDYEKSISQLIYAIVKLSKKFYPTKEQHSLLRKIRDLKIWNNRTRLCINQYFE